MVIPMLLTSINNFKNQFMQDLFDSLHFVVLLLVKLSDFQCRQFVFYLPQ